MKEGQNDICYITGESKKVVENSPFLEKLKKKGYESEDQKKFESLKEKFEGLCKVIKDVLGDKFEKVIVSDRAVDSPCCLVTGEKTMEINLENSIMEDLRKRADADKNNKTVKDLVLLLLEIALLTSGFSLEEPNTFGNRIHRMLKLGLSIDDDAADADADADMPPLEAADDAEKARWRKSTKPNPFRVIYSMLLKVL
ncbi:hypothetical protein GIB67_041236 [Kingdonia uniflora]|uniref:Heat shock protein 90 n=1 Tax=Kingdonia uniflora TaxID=39325 RepID=A0A7J7MGP9_9MAGN|nr:hypothetical protein GIB67_041236 [Kingdonia uniflora]